MTHPQHLSRLATDTAGHLRRLGCQILAATAINDHAWIKARLPQRLPTQERMRIYATAWQSPAIVEWRT